LSYWYSNTAWHTEIIWIARQWVSDVADVTVTLEVTVTSFNQIHIRSGGQTGAAGAQWVVNFNNGNCNNNLNNNNYVRAVRFGESSTNKTKPPAGSQPAGGLLWSNYVHL